VHQWHSRSPPSCGRARNLPALQLGANSRRLDPNSVGNAVKLE
jgi:hypothetical protein